MLFADERLNFFRPLTGKYREQVVACLRALYARLYSSLADYSMPESGRPALICGAR